MRSIIMLSELSLSVFLLWALLLCVLSVFSAVLAVTQKRYRFVELCAPVFLCGYFLWQMLFDIHLFGDSPEASLIGRKFGEIPYAFLILSLAFLTTAATAVFVLTVRYGKRSITPTAVKLCLDRMPCGVLLWRDNGGVLFSNICMNRLCIAVTKSPLLNGNHFFEAVRDGILTVEDKQWRFACRDIVLDGERLHEMIASNITAEYAKTRALEQDKAELSRLNRQLKEYNRGIGDTVRRQEILQAKVNIHDEMNRLMLSTVATDGDDTAALDRIFTLWGQNALLLCMEADKTVDNTAATARIEKLAEALKIRLVWREELPDGLGKAQKGLFFSAAQEAIVNAAKHARATRMEIYFEEGEDGLSCTFKNDGDIPSGEVRFSGGLYNLCVLAGKLGASVSASAGETFDLTLSFNNQPSG